MLNQPVSIRVRLCAVLVVLASLGFAATSFAAAGFQAFATTNDAATGEKPQSKLWFHDGSFWCAIQGPQGVAIFEKTGNAWVQMASMDAILAPAGQCDVKWDGTRLFILVYNTTPQLFKYTYDASLRIWLLESGFPVPLPRPSGAETMVLEEDSTGRLWTVAEGNTNICAYYSLSADHRTWSPSPIVLRTGVNTDDICSVVAFDGGNIGVFWSDQVRDEFGFRIHHDGADPSVWDAAEVVDAGLGFADDHIHLTVDAQAQVYALTKDDFDKMQLHRRSLSGVWSTQRDVVGGTGTRGIIMLSDADQKIYAIYTRWGGTVDPIEYREASLADLHFGPSQTLIATGGHSGVNNPTGTKQALPAGTLVAMADGGNAVWWNGWPATITGSQPPSPPVNLIATLQTLPPHVDLTWSSPVSGDVDGYDIYVQVNGGASQKVNLQPVTQTSFTDATPPLGSLCYRAIALRGTLQSGTSNSSCVSNQPIELPGTPSDVVLTPVVPGSTAGALTLWFDSGSGQSVQDVSGNGNDANLGSGTGVDSADPVWMDGVAGKALRFDGTNDYAHVSDAPVLDMDGSFTVEAWLQRTNAMKACVLHKGDVGARTYRIMVNANGAIEFSWDNRSGTARTLTSAALLLPNTGWHHVACVYDAAAQQNRIYFDGMLRTTGTASGQPAFNAASLFMGARRSGSSFKEPFAGAIDNVRVMPGTRYTANFTPLANPLTVTEPASILVRWTAPAGGGAAGSYAIHRAVDGGLATAVNSAPVTRTLFTDEFVPAAPLCYDVAAFSTYGDPGLPSAAVCIDRSGTPIGIPPSEPVAIGAPESLTVAWADTTVMTGANGAMALLMDAGAGQSAVDATGNANHAQLGSSEAADTADPTWVAGVAGSALRLDGSNDRCKVLDSPTMRMAGSFTIEGWIRRASTGTEDCLVSKGDTSKRNYYVMLLADGRIDFAWETAGGARHGVISSVMVTDSNWHHLACVYDKGNGQSRIFLDGILVQWAADSGTPVQSADAVYIGGRMSGGSLKSFLHGTVDMLRIVPAALYTSNFTPPTSYSAPTPRRVVRLTWRRPAAGTAAGYRVYRQNTAGTFDPIVTLGSAIASAVDMDAPAAGACYRVTAIDAASLEGAPSANACLAPVVKAQFSAEAPAAPRALAVSATPNPFNPSTELRFALPAAGAVQLRVYDARGARVATLVQGVLQPGAHVARWNGRTDAGAAAASGVYFARLEAGGAAAHVKLLLLK